MGFGDVKLMACIGAFLGWQAALFTIVAASFIGAVVGGVPKLAAMITKKDWSPRIPFGPYLAAGALLWVFAGPAIVTWWWNTYGGGSLGT
jgi:leader peptidase (prepilin peptidase)/N-methyltransferase